MLTSFPARQGSNRPDRANKRCISVHVDPELRRIVKRIAADQDMTMDLALHEALMLFVQHYYAPEAERRMATAAVRLRRAEAPRATSDTGDMP